MIGLIKLLKSIPVGFGVGTFCGYCVSEKQPYEAIYQSGVFRVARAANTVFWIVLDYKQSLHGNDVADEDYKQRKSQVHWRSAQKLLDLCCVNAGCFIKVGQHIAALEYLLPKEYTETLKILHSDAPITDIDKLYPVFEKELGVKINDVFEEIDPHPLGTASLAQVHKAKLKDGNVVAVKIQHPFVLKYCQTDMMIMDFLLRVVKFVFPSFQLMWLSEETKKNLPLELDFYHEGNNCEKIGNLLSEFKFFKVPKIYWPLSTSKVLTMEYCDGGCINDKKYMLENNISVHEVSKMLSTIYSNMIFVHGFIHCDPHPGNILVKKTSTGPQLTLIDHGLYQTLDNDIKVNYSHLWLSLINANIDNLKKYSKLLGIGEMYGLFACMLAARSWKSVTSGINKTKYTSNEEGEIQKEISTYLPQITEVLNSMNRQLLLILKTNDLIRGIETSLKTRHSAHSFIIMSQCCTQSIFKQKKQNCNNMVCVLVTSFMERYILFKIKLYSLYLYFINSFFL